MSAENRLLWVVGRKWKAYAANFGLVWLLRFAACALHCAVGFISYKTVYEIPAVMKILFNIACFHFAVASFLNHIAFIQVNIRFFLNDKAFI